MPGTETRGRWASALGFSSSFVVEEPGAEGVGTAAGEPGGLVGPAAGEPEEPAQK